MKSNKPKNRQRIVSDEEDSYSDVEINKEIDIEPLDYRRDWSHEIIVTFENLVSSFPLVHVAQYVAP